MLLRSPARAAALAALSLLAGLSACDRSTLPGLSDAAALTPGSLAADGSILSDMAAPSSDATPPDLAATIPADASVDLPAPDVALDLAPVTTDAATLPLDVAPDLAVDAAPVDAAAPDAPPPDAAVIAADARPDLAADAGVDASPDLARDVRPDLALDLAPDASPDLPPDVAPDAGPAVVAAPGGVMQDLADPRTIELYGVSFGNHHLVRRGGLGSAGIPEEDLGSPAGVTLQGTPAPLSWEKGRLDIFVPATDKFLYQRWFWKGVWQPWVPIGGTKLSSDPSISSWGVERLDLFARGEKDGDLQHLWYDHGWSQGWWESLGGQLGSAPSAIALAVNRIDIFARDPDDKLIHLAWDNAWLPWDNLGDRVAFGPVVTSRKAGIIEVYAGENNRRLRYFEWTPTSKSPWRNTNIEVPGDFRVVTVGPQRTLVLSRGASGEVWQSFLDHTD